MAYNIYIRSDSQFVRLEHFQDARDLLLGLHTEAHINVDIYGEWCLKLERFNGDTDLITTMKLLDYHFPGLIFKLKERKEL